MDKMEDCKPEAHWKVMGELSELTFAVRVKLSHNHTHNYIINNPLSPLPPPFQLNIRPLSSTSNPVSIQLPPSSSISSLRTLIESKTSVPSTDQRLIYRGKMLDDTGKNKSPVRIKDVGGLEVRGGKERSDEPTTRFLASLACQPGIFAPKICPILFSTHSKPLPACSLQDGCTIHLVPKTRPKSNSDPSAVLQSVSLPSSPARDSPVSAAAAPATPPSTSTAESFVSRAEALLSTIRDRRNRNLQSQRPLLASSSSGTEEDNDEEEGNRNFEPLRQVTPSEERSDELATPYLVTKIVRARTSVQDAPPL